MAALPGQEAPERSYLRVRGAAEHNLRSVDVDIPHDLLTVITGVSGSGKSSLAFDVIYREARRRYLESFSAQARQLMGKLGRPDVERVEGLRPAVAVGRRSGAANPRSTVGTLSEIYDWLRLLYARLGRAPEGLRVDRSLFSFNSPRGACPACRGLGVEDRVDPDLIVAHPERTLREGALALTTPNGYVIYSQVTMDVLDRVCRAHGFSVDIPWKDLGEEQRRVVLDGSDRILIPYGKHPLESRLRWKGITPKPRVEGTYKGILPVMEAILKAKRNANILRYVRSIACRSCGGARLNPEALSVRFRGASISELVKPSIRSLAETFRGWEFEAREKPAGEPIREALGLRAGLLLRLGLGHLTLDREAATLSEGEAQRIRLAGQCGNGLRGMLYVFDEPTAGIHPAEAERLFEVLREIRDNGNTVLVVEHDEAAIRAADHLIDLGPGAGPEGGRVLWSGPPSAIGALAPGISPTRDFLTGHRRIAAPVQRRSGAGSIVVRGARLHNLRLPRVEFRKRAFNVVTGVSGAGKATLVKSVLASRLAAGRFGPGPDAEGLDTGGWAGRLIVIDQSPIGRTPRSNPATYTKISNRIRDLFAGLPEAKARGWGKSRFSFNVPGGRCETCRGAGLLQVGMHFLGDVDVVCTACEGRRFNDETLGVRYRGRDIHEVLDLGIGEAVSFFSAEPRLRLELEVLERLGLGYMKLGQSSTTLSGGEAQRVKLSAELMRPESKETIYILEEPTNGLHARDVETLLTALQDLVDRGHTIISVEHNPDFIWAADRVIDLGPGSGDEGGRLVAEGTPEEISASRLSLTGRSLRGEADEPVADRRHDAGAPRRSAGPILLAGVTTHNLRGVDAAIPYEKMTVITGPSGSGKSSLAFDTLFAESRRRFLESFSTYVRSRLDKGGRAEFVSAWGLTPPIAVGPRSGGRHPRSTVGTLTEIYDDYRLLFSRAGRYPRALQGRPLPASRFSFNHEEGACPRCRGLGFLNGADPESFVTHPDKPLTAGALDGTKTGRFYGDPHGQHVAALQAAGRALGIDFGRPFAALSEDARRTALFGTGDKAYDILWAYRRGRRSGEFRFRGPWPGFVTLIDREYERKHADRRGEALRVLMAEVPCPDCRGARLKPEPLAVTFGGRNIAELSRLSVGEAWELFSGPAALPPLDPRSRAAAEAVGPDIRRRLQLVRDVGLDYLAVDRSSSSLSGGESQRLRLASLLGAKLTGVTFVLDEPTLGLHPRDTRRLIGLLRGLVRERNTVVVVEHDLQVVRAADHVIDLGPGAGRDGGRIVARGNPAEIAGNAESATGRALAKQRPARPFPRPIAEPGVFIAGARAHNLRSIDVEFPARGLTAVTGVSGSGKTSLVFDVLYRSVRAGRPVDCAAIRGFERFGEVVLIDQSPVSADPSSIPLTYAGLFDAVRGLYAGAAPAKSAGLKKAHFSFLTPEGRCETCRGAGVNRVSLDFVADVETPCEACGGTRFNPAPLAILWNGLSIAQALALTVSEAAAFFSGRAPLARALAVLAETGLGYLQLGQSLGTLSGGEGQRLKLAARLLKPAAGPALFLFDEPTAGLHPADVERLLAVFERLLGQGHTLVVVEHDLDVIAQANHVLDLGPEGGDGGGRLIASGSPAAISDEPRSFTGKALRERFGMGG